jgi:hypothetical protein
MAKQGGLIGYGPRMTGVFRLLGRPLVKILRGTSPGDIPIEQPSTRACRQSNSRKGNRPGYPGELRPARRQVDRMKRPLPDMALFGHRIVGL